MMPNVMQYRYHRRCAGGGYAVVNITRYTPAQLEHQLKDFRGHRRGGSSFSKNLRRRCSRSWQARVKQVIGWSAWAICSASRACIVNLVAAAEENGAGLFDTGAFNFQRRAGGRPRMKLNKAEASARRCRLHGHITGHHPACQGATRLIAHILANVCRTMLAQSAEKQPMSTIVIVCARRSINFSERRGSVGDAAGGTNR